ncbi:MAG TPA: sigma-70 family RNA polymerase sigma factor [Gemmatimonadaceae bacterium]|nr:sigma-70 family RNA polymerase sigma factor [Gemmatimonadaceae bacterium]
MSTTRALAVTRRPVAGYNEATMTDALLVRAALDGDSTAFATLVQRHGRVCLRYATRMLGNREDAEDATQEAFVRAYGALGRFDGSVAFRTWLMTILINRCRTALSRRRRDDERVDASADVATIALASERQTDDMALRDAIGQALGRLEAVQREAFLLKHVEQLSYEEMSAMTGVGVSALKMRVQRACERLQVLLRETDDA